MLFGTEEQKKKYLPRVARQEISAFALTEWNAGSDPANMSLRADPTEDGSAFILNGEKLWCTNLIKAGVLVVMAKTPPKIVNGKERKQITAFIVDVDSPGLEITYRCHFMGLRALYNGIVKFTNVRVPRENMIAKEGQGLKVALTTLNTGRLTIPAACVGLSKRLLEICRKWASERVQWGVPIGQHYAIAGKIAEMAGNVFAMEAITFLTSALVDRKAGDLRIETAMCKMWATETTWRIADEAMQVRGGRGYETAQSLAGRGEEPIAVERFLRDCRINMIFEGSSEIMRLFIAREALDPHLKVGGAIFNTQLPMSERVKAIFTFREILRELVSETVDAGGRRRISTNLHADLRPHVHYAARTSKKTRARFVPRHGAVRSEARSRTIVALAFCRNRDRTFRDERDLLVRAAQDRSRRTGGRSSFGCELLLPLGQNANRSSFCRHRRECRPARLRSDPGVARRKTRRFAQRDCVVPSSRAKSRDPGAKTLR